MQLEHKLDESISRRARTVFEPMGHIPRPLQDRRVYNARHVSAPESKPPAEAPEGKPEIAGSYPSCVLGVLVLVYLFDFLDRRILSISTTRSSATSARATPRGAFPSDLAKPVAARGLHPSRGTRT